MRKDEIPEEGLQCLGSAVEGVLTDAGVEELIVRGVMDALAEATGDETIQDGVDFLRAIADENDVSRDDQDVALLEMFARAKSCYEERTGELERRDERECDCDRQEQQEG